MSKVIFDFQRKLIRLQSLVYAVRAVTDYCETDTDEGRIQLDNCTTVLLETLEDSTKEVMAMFSEDWREINQAKTTGKV